jgi:hypothetical protein
MLIALWIIFLLLLATVYALINLLISSHIPKGYIKIKATVISNMDQNCTSELGFYNINHQYTKIIIPSGNGGGGGLPCSGGFLIKQSVLHTTSAIQTTSQLLIQAVAILSVEAIMISTVGFHNIKNHIRRSRDNSHRLLFNNVVLLLIAK